MADDATRRSVRKLTRWPRSAVEVVRDVLRAFREDRVTGLAGEVAFFTFLSLWPTMLALAAALGSLQLIVGDDVAARAEREVLELLERVLTSEAQDTIDAVSGLFASTNAGLFTFGALTAMWAASRGFASVIHALDAAYGRTETRSTVEVRLLGLMLALGTVLVSAVMLGMLVAGPLFGTGREIADEIGLGGAFALAWDWFRWPVLALIMIAWAATVYHVAPNHRSPWRWDLPGSVLTMVWWAVASFGIRYYIDFAGEANQVLAAVGGTFIVMMWLYVQAIGLLLGGELNAVLAARAGVERSERAHSKRLVALRSFVTSNLRSKRRRRSPEAGATPPSGPVEHPEAAARSDAPRQPGGDGGSTDAERPSST